MSAAPSFNVPALLAASKTVAKAGRSDSLAIPVVPDANVKRRREP
jgi:hypothetical protein